MMSSKDKKPKGTRGGWRPGSGRPPKADKDEWGQITCVLKKDMIEKLRKGAGGHGKYFGQFLQHHLDRYPPPSREMYLAILSHQPIVMTIKRKKVPVIISAGGTQDDVINRVRMRKVKAPPISREEFQERLRQKLREHDLSRKTV